jgi:hypothetical protein
LPYTEVSSMELVGGRIQTVVIIRGDLVHVWRTGWESKGVFRDWDGECAWGTSKLPNKTFNATHHF